MGLYKLMCSSMDGIDLHKILAYFLWLCDKIFLGCNSKGPLGVLGFLCSLFV